MKVLSLFWGLSPRTRGSLDGARAAAAAYGPIPADAGEPTTNVSPERSRRAYPRGRGGACFGVLK